MSTPLEDYALIGDLQSAALVSRDGSIDWLCLPRFDSGACFAALLGTPAHGRWRIAPAAAPRRTSRRYRPGTLVLETSFETGDGRVELIDCMPVRGEAADVARLVRGVEGTVRMRMDLVLRFDYGHVVPWVRRADGRLLAIAGPDAVLLTTDVPTHGEDMATVAEFEVSAGEEVAFLATWFPSHRDLPHQPRPAKSVSVTQEFWERWSERSAGVGGRWADAVQRSLITLKALTYLPTGGIVAAPTAALPEHLGGVRNWDYRYCWVRDATLTLLALLESGYSDEAAAWRRWLLRAVAGRPAEMQIMYGVAGERRLTELELDWLPGYEGSAPVRIGNAAAEQFQLDVYGEVMDALHQARRTGLETDDDSWALQLALLEFLEQSWAEPDDGLWEMRGSRRHFTHSKVMAWVAFDRGVRAVEEYGLEGPADRWRAIRDEIHREVCERGWSEHHQSFSQSYESDVLDAALLMIPIVGFLAPDDERVVSTVAAIRRELCRDGLILRYPTETAGDGLPPGEGTFLPCSFWLVEVLALMGEREQAEQLMERLVGLANDVGLLAEEYDTELGRQVGNFPQAFTHLALVSAAVALAGPATGSRRSA